MNTTPAKPRTVDEYIDAQPEAVRERMQQLRELSRAAAPEAQEAIKWGSPAYLHPQGTILFVYSAHRLHSNFTFTPSIREAFAEELTDFETGKGSVKIPHETEVPRELLERMITARWKEFTDDGVNWM